MKRTTIQDIADALGLSRNTVSKAINNSEGLSDETRDKILRTALEMGYKQFSYISSLSSLAGNTPMGLAPSRAGEIAVLTANPSMLSVLSNHFSIPVLDRVKQEFTQRGYLLQVHKVEPDDLSRRALPASCNLEHFSAIICVEMFDWDYNEMLCRLGIPVLFIDGPNKRSGNSLPADQLYMDNTTGITKLVNEMLQKGKKKIGFIGDYEHCQSFFERYLAFRSAMMLAGVPVDEAFCVKSNHPDLDSSLSALPGMPDLFICANDFVANIVSRLLRGMGVSVPKDVLLCGFDDAPEARIMLPALTTVHIHSQIMALTAVHLLLTRMNTPSLDYRTVYTATELIWRDSTKC